MAHHEVEKVLLVGPLPEVRRASGVHHKCIECVDRRFEVQKPGVKVVHRAEVLRNPRGRDRGPVGTSRAEVYGHAVCRQEQRVNVGVCDCVCVDKEDALVFCEFPGLEFEKHGRDFT